MTDASRAIRQPKVSELVADILRERIIRGEFVELLPSQDSLLSEFSISKPSLREALRMLESEGLITIRRGNLGGAFVHRPEPRHAAYMLGLVLASRSVPVEDVGTTLTHLEGVCAGLCAAREDRETEVLPRLRDCNERSTDELEEPMAFVKEMAIFHRLLAELSGSASMQLVVGALETVWLAQLQEWAEKRNETGTFFDRDYRQAGLDAHIRMTELIAAGDIVGATRAAQEHLDPGQFYSEDFDPTRTVRTTGIRSPGARTRASMAL